MNTFPKPTRKTGSAMVAAALALLSWSSPDLAAQQLERLRAPATIQGHVTDVQWVNGGEPDRPDYFAIPGDQDLSAVWSDGAFAVHIPFALDTPPGEVTKILVWVGFEGFDEYTESADAEPGVDDAGTRWSPWSVPRHASSSEMPEDIGSVNGSLVGVIGPGGAFPEGISMSWPVVPHPEAPGIGISRSSKVGSGFDGGDTTELEQASPRPIRRMSATPGHRPFERGEDGLGGFSYTLHFPEEAPRGDYALWFTGYADSLWRRWSGRRPEAGPLEPPTELRGTIRAYLYAVTTEESPGGVEVAMGYSDDRDRVSPDLALWRRLADVEVPLSTRLNGWIRAGDRTRLSLATFEDHSNRLIGRFGITGEPTKDPVTGDYYIFAGDGSISLGGGQASYWPEPATAEHWRSAFQEAYDNAGEDKTAELDPSWNERGEESPTRHGRTDLTYQVQYPTEMNDFSIADVRVSGTFNAEKESHTYWSVDLDDTPATWDNVEEDIVERSQTSVVSQVWSPSFATVDLSEWDDEWRRQYEAPQSGWDDNCEMGPNNEQMREGARPSGCTRSPSGTFRHLVRPPPSGHLEPGERVIFRTELNGLGTINPTYRRRSEMESLLGGITTGHTASDPVPDRVDRFWTWYVTDYLPASTLAIERLDEARGTATSAGLVVAENDRRARILLESLRTQDQRDDRGLFQRFSDSFASDDPVGISQATWDLMLQRVRSLNREKQAALALVEAEVTAAGDHVDRVLATIADQRTRTDAVGAGRPELTTWRRFWEHHRSVSVPALYLRGRHTEGWDTAAADLELEALDSNLRIEIGNLYMQQGRPAAALFQYRSAARVSRGTPDEARANTLAAPIEAALLRAVATKLSGEVGAVRDQFFGYLRGRLGDDADVSGVLGYFQHAWQVFSTGLGAVASDRVGRTDAMEGEAAAVLRTGALTWLGLNAMAELAERGTSLSEVHAGLDGEALKRRLGLRRATGDPYSAADYAELGTGIRTALALPEVQAILAESEQLLETAMADNNFDLDTVSVAELRSDRYEFAFDITSGKNTMMLMLPHSVGTVGGSFARLSLRPFTGSQWAAEMRWAAALGQEIRTGQEIVSSIIGWERVLRKLSTARLLTTLSSQVQRMHRAGGIVWKATWGTSPFMADLLLSQGIVHVAETYGGPHVAAAADALLFTFLFDPDLCATLLRRSGTSGQQVRQLVARYGDNVRAYRYGYEESSDVVHQLQDQLSQQGQAALPWDFRGTGDVFVPGLDDLHNQRFAVASAIAAAREGRIEDARRATAAAAALLPGAGGRLDADLEPTLAMLERIPDQIDPRLAGAVDVGEVVPLPHRRVRSQHLELDPDSGDVRPGTGHPPARTADLGRGENAPHDTVEVLPSTVDNPADQGGRDRARPDDELPGTRDSPPDDPPAGTVDNPNDQQARDGTQADDGPPSPDDRDGLPGTRDGGDTPGPRDDEGSRGSQDGAGDDPPGTVDNPGQQQRRDRAARDRARILRRADSEPPRHAVDLTLLAAEDDPVTEAMNAGKLSLAAGDGEEARRHFDAAAALGGGEAAPLELAGLRRTADELATFQSRNGDLPVPTRPAPDVSDQAFRDIVGRPGDGNLLKRDTSDRGDPRNVVWEMTGDDGRKYALKHVMPYPPPPGKFLGGRHQGMVVESLEAEMITPVLSAFFGGTAVVPARARIAIDDRGQLVRGEVVSAWVEGTEIRDFSAGELLALRDDYLESRILSMVAGDYDRHGGNYMLSEGSGLVGLDWGQGHVTSGLGHSQKTGRVEDAWSMESSHHFFESRRNQTDVNPDGQCPPNLWTLEQSLTYDDASPIIERYKERFHAAKDELRESIRAKMYELHVDGAGFDSVEDLRAKMASLPGFEPHALRDPDVQTEAAMHLLEERINTMLDRYAREWNGRMGLPEPPAPGTAAMSPAARHVGALLGPPPGSWAERPAA